VWRGDIWSFWVVSNINWNPTPAHQATFVPVTTDLSWSKGKLALKGHIIYFSTDFATVNNRVPGTTGGAGYLGATPAATTTIAIPGDLLYNKTYYWRADVVETTSPMKAYKGEVWEFKTTVAGTGSILREIWEGITPTGTAISLLYAWPDFPENPTTSVLITSFDSPAHGIDQFGGRIHGWVFAPVSGNYTFYLASDDAGELWLSTDENPANAQLIASEDSWAGDKAWQYGNERSAPISLVGGNKYYIGALWKEGGGGDNCAVGWTGPGISAITVIPGGVLMPFVQYWAYDPIPANEAAGVATTPTLSWLSGRYAASHNVYFGTSYADVKAGTGGTLKGNQPRADTDYVPSPALEAAKVYYWKITEVNNTHPDLKWEGPVWVFRVAGGAGGLLGSYYHHTGGNAPAGFETFVLSRIDPEINFGWGDGSPDPLINVNQFSSRWQGQVEAPFSGDYIFYPATDDGERLWVDDQLIVDQWWDQGTTEVASAPIALVAGQKYDIVMEQYENGGGATAYLRWEGPSISKRIIPAMWLWPPTKATSPVPTNGSTTAPLQPTLSWTAGVYAAAVNGHRVYFDADQAKVIARVGCLVNGVSTTNPSYGLLPTFGLEETYYWAVDEVNGVNSWAGDVWIFTTVNNKVIDDMELYPPNVVDSNIYQVWIDGAGDCASIPGNNSGALVDIELVTYLGGLQAMKLVYDNDGTVWNPCTAAEQGGRLRYSKVEALVSQLPSGIGSDWTVGGAAKSLSLQFYGTVGNAVEPLWVRLTDASNNTAKVSYGLYADENTADMSEASWHEWLIDLGDFTGVNMSNVKSIAIGVGNEAGGSSGSGTLYFDDIRLYTPRCVLARREAAFAKFDYAPEGYLGGGDCVVNGLELEVMTRDWLEVDYTAPSLMARYLLDGNYDDASGNGNHGTAVGAGITFVADVPPRTQVLDLPGGDNIYVDCNTVGISGAMPRTIACWAKADNTTIPDWTLVFGFTGMPNGSGGNGSHFNIDSIGGPGGVGAHCWGWEETIFTDTEALEWRHYAMTYDGT
ncbi:MAG: PA14 domain-containing protein, partial [Planctomycetota bacterium]